MRVITERTWQQGVWAALSTLAIITSPYNTSAQVRTDITSSGLNTQIAPPTTLPNGQISSDITGGTRPGNGPNLFHSFGQFSVGEGHIANFLNNSGLPTANILGRVTGGTPSNIFGTLQTTGFGNANLFLLNPAGVIFGPTASLNVGGSVSVSTANYIKLTDGVRFNAIPGIQDAMLSVAPVAAFGFLGNNAAAIAVDGSTLRVAEGQSITLVGGNTGFTDTTGSIVSGGVSITNGSLIAPGGTINIVSVGKSSKPGVGGQVPLNPTEPITGFANMGDVAIVRNVGDFAQLTTTGNSGGGKIVIRGGQIEVQNYRIVADAGDNTLGEVAIQGKNVSITNRPDIPCFGCGAGEGIRIGANRGTLTITGTDSVALDGALIGGAIDPFSVFPTGPVTISAPTVSVSDTSFRIGGNALMRGRLDILGENVTIISSSMLKGENFSPVDVNILAQNLAYINGFNMPLLATGDRVGSSVSIQARDIQMIGTRIDTQHLFMDGLGDAGPITIAGRRNVTIMDSEFTSNTAAVPRAGTPGVSDGGTIAITAGKDLEVSNSMIAAETRWAGHGGNILLGAGTNVTVENSTLSVKSNMTGTDTFHGIGPAGNIAIGAGKNVSVKNSTLSANSQGMAEAGVIGIGAGKNITVNQSTVTAEGLGGGGDGHIVFGAGHNISLKGSTVTPAPVIFEGLD